MVCIIWKEIELEADIPLLDADLGDTSESSTGDFSFSSLALQGREEVRA